MRFCGAILSVFVWSASLSAQGISPEVERARLLMKSGALDAYTTAIQMKQNRPAVKLSVICKPQDKQRMENIIFGQRLTFGIRRQLMDRTKLDREFVDVETEYGTVKVKVGKLDGKIITAKPEYSDCLDAANKHNVSIKHVQQTVMGVFNKRSGE